MTSSSDRPPRPGARPSDALFEALSGEAGGVGGGASPRFAEKLRRAEPPPKAGAYSRFIPREELGGFAAWRPGSFGDDPSRKPQAAPDPEALRREAEAAARREVQRQAAEAAQQESDRIEALRLARDGGYQDGYRDGLVALDSFKQTFSAQTSAQVAALVQQLQGQFDALEQDLARRVAGIALDLARQVVRSELSCRPEGVVAVAQEALSVLLMSARHVALRFHPDDHGLVASGCAELLSARDVRLLPDPQVERGGCRVESDIGEIDAEVATRWQRMAAAFGQESAWTEAGGSEPRLASTDDAAAGDGPQVGSVE